VRMSGARIVLECLKREGVDVLFGLPGGAVLPIYDALYDFQGIRHILVRQEAAAGHAAEGYARTTGKVGACLVTSGPAATNLVTALQDAYMDSIPIVAFTGQVPTHLIGNDAFQEADNVGITRSCTKHNFLVKDGKDLGPIIREAFHIAATGRPGPVHVDLPKDVLVKEWELVWPEKVQLRSYNPTYDGHPGQIKRAAKLLVRARKPVLYVGGGTISSDASAELLELAELTQIPVTQTLMGLGAFPMEHPLSLDMLGMHGSYYANMAVHHSDVLVAVGARFDDRVTGRVDAFAPNAEIVHIDIDPSSISKNIQVHVPIVGDCRRVLRALVDAVREEMRNDTPSLAHEARKQWLAQIAEWKARHPLGYAWDDELIKPQYVMQEISNLTRGEAMIITGVGQHQMWAAQYYRFKHPRRWCTSGGLGTMGYGLPTAMGVAAAHPDRLVVNVDGGHHLQGAVLRHRLRAEPRLRQAGRGLRLRRDPREQAVRGGARAGEGVRHAGARRRRRGGGQVGVRVPDGAGRRGQPGHDPRKPDRGREGQGREVADGVLDDQWWRAAKAHDRGPRREQVRRPLARRRPLLGARLQHREPLGR